MNNLLHRLLFVVPVAALFAVGCVTPPRDNGFVSVRDDVRGRTGNDVTWNTRPSGNTDSAALDRLLAQALNADRAVQIALLNNLNLQATYEELGIAQADVVQAGLLRNPVFNGDLKFSLDGGGTKVEVAVVEDFLDVFLIPLRKKIAGRQFEVAKLRVTAEAIELATKTREATYAAQHAGQTLELRRTVLEADRAAFELATRLRAAGNVTELDLATQRAVFEQAKLDVAEAEAGDLDGREKLNVLLGLWGSRTQWKIDGHLPELPAEFSPPENIERDAIRSSLALKTQSAEWQALATTVGLKSGWSPWQDVEFGAAAERENAGGWSAGPALSTPIPIFDTGQAALAGARARFEQASQKYYAAAVEIRSDARAAANRLAAAYARANYIRTVMIPLRHQITEQTKLQNNAMQVGTFQLLQAKKDEIQAGAAYIEALRDYWVARARVAQFVGLPDSESNGAH